MTQTRGDELERELRRRCFDWRSRGYSIEETCEFVQILRATYDRLMKES